MSTEKTQNVKNNYEFLARFIEVCGTTEAAKIQRLLDISYQAAKNYLNGRIPDPKVLITIAERTPYSLHWLLTGKGEKLVLPRQNKDTTILTGQIRDLVRDECVQILRDVIQSAEKAKPRVITLSAEKVSSEKILRDELVTDLNSSAKKKSF